MFLCVPLHAQVSLDGTLGRSGALSGPDYQIGAHDGQQHGGNLFHSFQDFNLQSFESATFSGPNSVNNVISRVTGGNPSNIDGLLRSTIPNADMYFLNPYGIMFGPNAKLDVLGSFHASTADTLRLQDGGQFNARQPGNSLLTVAPVEAFGFLTNTPAAITTFDSDLSVPEGQTFSLIGGDLRLNGQSPLQFSEDGFAAIFARSKLAAASGRINLASLASIGEIIPREFELDLTGEGGTITANNTLIDVSGRGSGEVFIRGGQFVMENATIQANTLADLDGKNIDMRLSESIDIRSNLPTALNQSLLNQTFGSGNGGDIVIVTPRLELIGNFLITTSLNTGHGGNIEIEAVQVFLKEGAIIQAFTRGSGSSGHLHIKATEMVLLSGEGRDNVTRVDGTANFPSSIASFSYSNSTGQAGTVTIETGSLKLDGGIISADSFGQGNAGQIEINASNLELTGGALISSSTLATGKGGDININITDTLSVAGRREGPLVLFAGLIFNNNQSGISSIVLGNNQAGQVTISASSLLMADGGGISTSTFSDGTAGSAIIKVKELRLTGGASISSSSGFQAGEELFIGNGKGGTLDITATGDILIDGQDEVLGIPSAINSDTLAGGQGGNLFVSANHLTLQNGGTISATSIGTGNAGDIFVSAEALNLTDQSAITAEAENAAGGNITITTPNLLYLRGGQITTSVGTGKGRGGDITIFQPMFVVLDKGKIKAQADEGHGGDIHITSNQFVASPDSLVSASSRLGIDGDVEIDAPEVNMEDFMVVLPGGFVDVSLKRCDIQDIENPSSFRVTQEQRVPPFVRIK